jgi:hypothetical protein
MTATDKELRLVHLLAMWHRAGPDVRTKFTEIIKTPEDKALCAQFDDIERSQTNETAKRSA